MLLISYMAVNIKTIMIAGVDHDYYHDKEDGHYYHHGKDDNYHHYHHDDDDDDNDCTEFRHLASCNVDKTIHLSFRSLLYRLF